MIKNINYKIKTETEDSKNNFKTTYYYQTLDIMRFVISKSNII